MKIIVLEGLDASGKDTVADKLRERLVAVHGEDAVRVYRDPGSTQLGEELRRLLLDPGLRMSPTEQTLLFTAARHALARQIMGDDRCPNRRWIVLNRWYFSTLVYQTQQGMPRRLIDHLNEMFAPLPLVPKLCFLLDITVDAARQRMDRVGRSTDRFEGANADVFKERRLRYQCLADNGMLTRIDANRSVDTVVREIYERALQVHD